MGQDWRYGLSSFESWVLDLDVPREAILERLRPVPELSRPGAPAFVPKGLEYLLGDVDPVDWLNRLMRRRRQRRFEQAMQAGDRRPVLVSEGDSFFQMPVVLDVVDHLEQDHLVWSLDAAGATLEEMVGPKAEYMEGLRRQRDRVRAFLFSGAGNDVVGFYRDAAGRERSVLSEIVSPFEPGKPPEAYIDNDAFRNTLGKVVGGYETIIHNVRAEFPSLPILVHAYDYALPWPQPEEWREPAYQIPRNSWLGGPLKQRGIKESAAPGLPALVIREIVDALDCRLRTLCGGNAGGRHAHVYMVDTVGTTIDRTAWVDELHLSSEGYRAMAEKFRGVLRSVMTS